MDDTEMVLGLLWRYTACQQELSHQSSPHRDRAAQMARDLMEQAAALYEVIHADPQRWEIAEREGAASTLEQMKTAYEEMSLTDIKAHGVTWMGRV